MGNYHHEPNPEVARLAQESQKHAKQMVRDADASPFGHSTSSGKLEHDQLMKHILLVLLQLLDLGF